MDIRPKVICLECGEELSEEEIKNLPSDTLAPICDKCLRDMEEDRYIEEMGG